MTLTIERSALCAVIATRFSLTDFETTVLESLADKSFTKIDNNRLIDRHKQYAESIVLSCLLYLKPATDIEHILNFISALYESNRDIASRMNLMQQYTQTAPARLGRLTDLKLVNPSIAVELRDLLRGD